MRPPRLAEAPQQRRVARVEKHEPHGLRRLALQLPVDEREARERLALADVDDDGRTPDLAWLTSARSANVGISDRQVVDAEVAEILERRMACDCRRRTYP
jgi:hypothetical protein